MFSRFFYLYFANATYFYVKTEMVYSFLFSRRSFPEQFTVVSAYIFILVPCGNQTLAPCSTNWATSSQSTWCLTVLNYCLVRCSSSWWWKVYRYKPRWPTYVQYSNVHWVVCKDGKWILFKKWMFSMLFDPQPLYFLRLWSLILETVFHRYCCFIFLPEGGHVVTVKVLHYTEAVRHIIFGMYCTGVYNTVWWFCVVGLVKKKKKLLSK